MEQEQPDRPGAAKRRRAVALIGLATGACLLAGVGVAATRDHRSAPAAQATAPVRASGRAAPARSAVEAVLANRARAVREHDRIGFLATVASAPAAFQTAQAKEFDNLAKLPLKDWQETFQADQTGTSIVKVSLRYGFKGFDRGLVGRTRYLAFAPRAGTWVITGDGTGDGLRDDSDIWDGGPLTVYKGRSCLVIGDAPHLDELARRLDADVPKVTAVVGKGWSRRAVALVPNDPALATAMAGEDQDLGEIAALATVAPSATGGRGEDRVLISPGTFGRLNELGRDVVLTHELTHVATGGARDDRTPLWLIEGFADYVGYRKAKVGVRSAARELRREVTTGRLPTALPGQDAFAGDSPRLSQAYQEAWLACRMVADRYGEAALVRLYRAAGRRPEATALREVLDVTPARFTSMWRDYLQKELR
ncbi:hypothetical protein J4573_36190 [Actinomadura barringtoniae]|uniref:Peptidase MA-like domain-containing protein n=1 Tax=Actinomadura barringtoniae TaxID=1427535 RepID=A0A939PMF5_9ACTN|nr:hypothetical protein [Actinomadura barringtoniae]MBO2452579.1 hypothetical protein [Actinomadura barringtoniae]